MAITSQSTISTSSNRAVVIQIADVCFEMFSVKELRQPRSILRELSLSFPEAQGEEIQQAISLALSWRLSLRSLGSIVH